MLMRYKDSPDPPLVQRGAENKVMHASLRIGDTTVPGLDGQAQGRPSFQGFALSLTVPNEAEAERTLRVPRRRRSGAHAVGQDVLFAAPSAWSPTASESRGWFT